MSNQDETLENRIRTGDAEALAELVQRNRFQLLATLDRKVGAGLRSKLELEDILQEALARAVKDLKHVDFGDQSPLGWIYQILDRQIIDLHRYHFEAKKRDAAKEVSADQPLKSGFDDVDQGLANLLVASLTSPSEAFSRDIKLQRIYSAIESLAEDMQLAIRWRYLENLSSKEIATRLGKTDVAARVLLSRALRKLQEKLRGD